MYVIDDFECQSSHLTTQKLLYLYSNRYVAEITHVYDPRAPTSPELFKYNHKLISQSKCGGFGVSSLILIVKEGNIDRDVNINAWLTQNLNY